MRRVGTIRRAAAVAALYVFAALALYAQAQSNYPERSIRLIIPYAPGGATDIMGRKFAARVGPLLGQNLVPDNKAGANGVIGTTEAARAKPDGYTLLVGTSSTHALNPTAMDNPPYDPVKDFAPIAVLGIVPIVISVHPSVPAKTLRELVALVRKSPGQYAYGSSGVGSINHLAGELLQKQVPGFVIQHVPYKGSGPSAVDLIAGQIPLLIATFSSVSSHYKSGKLRILAVFSETRMAANPEIPTAIESGVPGMLAYTYSIICTPAGTPRPVIDALYRATAQVMLDKAFQNESRDLGFESVTDSNPDQAGRFIKEELARWAPIIKATGAKLE
jgi:tripartite-type tricarboxylate transporter receptor subunit TctC